MMIFMKWWFIICIATLGVAIAVFFDIHLLLYDADITKLSFLILLIMVFTSIWIGKMTYNVAKGKGSSPNLSPGWFISESCLSIGMAGTIIGLLFMLGTAFQSIDISNTTTLQNALSLMAKGMSTALYTTLTGLVASLLIKVQLVNLETEVPQP